MKFWLWRSDLSSSHQHVCVWIPDEAEVWKPAELIRDYTPGDLTLSLRLDDGAVRSARFRAHALGWKWGCDVGDISLQT